MNDLIVELNNLNKEYISNNTEHISFLLKHCRRTINANDDIYNTKNIKISKLSEEIRKRTKLVRIDGIGFPLNCYENSKLFEKAKTKSVKRRWGFNLFTCPCNKRLIAEPHALNEIDGELYDFTKDPLGESHKYFMMMDDMIPFEKIAAFNLEVNNKKQCKCNNSETLIPHKISMEQFVNLTK